MAANRRRTDSAADREEAVLDVRIKLGSELIRRWLVCCSVVLFATSQIFLEKKPTQFCCLFLRKHRFRDNSGLLFSVCQEISVISRTAPSYNSIKNLQRPVARVFPRMMITNSVELTHLTLKLERRIQVITFTSCLSIAINHDDDNGKFV